MAKKNLVVSTGDTTYDKIWAYYLAPEKHRLTPFQQKVKDRWVTLNNFRLNFHSRMQAINAYLEHMEKAGTPISRAQGYRDMKNVERLFGALNNTNRNYERYVLAEYAHKALLLALKQKNPIAMTQALSKLEKYQDLDKETIEQFNPEKLENKPDLFEISPEMKQVVLKHLSSGVVDFNNLDVQDIEYKEIEEEDEEDY